MNAFYSSGQSQEAKSLLEATRSLLPQVQACGDQIESERKLPTALSDALASVGIYKMLVPKSIGGSEVDPETFCLILEELSRVDGSTGWCAMITAIMGTGAAFLAEDVAWEIFGKEPNACVAISAVPAPNPSQRTPDRAIAVEGGYRVTGRWSFASACMHTTWLVGQGRVYDGDEARVDGSGQPVSRSFFFPISECRIIDTWNTVGLRGSGSHDFSVTDSLVTDPYILPRAHDLRAREPGLLYLYSAGRTPSGALGTPWTNTGSIGVAAVCLGIARGALDDLIAIAANKTPYGTSARLVNSPVFQDQIGRAEAILGAARAYLHHTTRDTWQSMLATGECPPNLNAMLRLTSTHAATLASQVIDMVWTAAGASAIFVANPIERRFRDLHTATQNIGVRPDNYTAAGRIFLGVE